MEAARDITFAPRRSRVVEGLNLHRIDGAMLGAALGLIAFSIFTLGSATNDEIAGQPMYFVVRQGLYAASGTALMIGPSRFGHTRLRAVRGTLYGVMVGSIVLVLLGGAAVRGSHRWIELPLFRFEPSELAKVLLCVSLSAVVFERIRRPFGVLQTFRF